MWLCGPLLGVWADVGAAAGDGEDQSFGAEDLDGVQDCVTAYVVLLLELFIDGRGPFRHSPLAILARRMAASCW